MLIQGEFVGNNNIVYKLEINNKKLSQPTLEIGKTYNYQGKEIKIFFGEDPLTIERKWDDSLLTHIIKSSLEINLVISDFNKDFFCSNDIMDIEVKVTSGDKVIFQGFILPNEYNQPYAYDLEDISLNAIDTLSVLKYFLFNDIKNEGGWALAKKSSSILSFQNIISSLHINDGNLKCYGSLLKRADNTSLSLLYGLGVSTDVFLGEKYDDLYTQEEVLTELMKYVNLHIIQLGDIFYIFDLDEYEIGNSACNVPIFGTDTYGGAPLEISNVNIKYLSDDKNISLDDRYSLFKVVSKTDMILEDAILNPLDKENLSSPYNRELYMREHLIQAQTKATMISNGDTYGFYYLYNENLSNDAKHLKSYYFVQYKEANNWLFGHYYNLEGAYRFNSIYDNYGEKMPQYRFINELFRGVLNACGIFSWGKLTSNRVEGLAGKPLTTKTLALVEADTLEKSDSNTDKVDDLKMKDYLCIFTLAQLKFNDENQNYDSCINAGIGSDGSILDSEGRYGVAMYESPDGEVIWSPSNDSYRTFLVFSGSIKLQKKLGLQCNSTYEDYNGDKKMNLSMGLRLRYELKYDETLNRSTYQIIPKDESVGRWSELNLIKKTIDGEDNVYNHCCEFYTNDEYPLIYRNNLVDNLFPISDTFENDFLTDPVVNGKVEGDYSWLEYVSDEGGTHYDEAIGPDGNTYYALRDENDYGDEQTHYIPTSTPTTKYLEELAADNGDGGVHEEYQFPEGAYHHRYNVSIEGTDFDKDNIEFKYCALYDEEGNLMNTYKTDNTYDNVNYLPLVECELSCGDFVLVEVTSERFGLPMYKWVKKDKSTEYKIKTFTLGCDINIGDKIFEKEFKIKDTTGNIDGIEQEGLKIEIPQEVDGEPIKGRLSFKILGVCNLIWDDIIRRDGSLFRHSSYRSQLYYIQHYLHCLYMTNFEVKLAHTSDYQEVDTNQDLVVQCNDPNVNWTNEKEVEFNIITQPSDEDLSSGIAPNINRNVVYTLLNNGDYDYNGKLKSYNNELIKAEDWYCSYYWLKFSKNRLKVQSTLRLFKDRFNLGDLHPKRIKMSPMGNYGIEMNNTISLKFNTKTVEIVEL